MNGKFLTVKQAREMLGVTAPTLKKWSEQGKITAVKVPSGVRRYRLEDIQHILGCNEVNEEKKQVIYCRVSSQKQSDDLERQINFCKQQYPDHSVVTDIASGLNWKRKGLQAILEQAIKGTVSEVVVAHRDRLCRFGFELLEWLFKVCNVKLHVLQSDTGKSSDSELTDDILSIIHVYSCRNMGRRRYQSKKSKTEPDTESTENAEEVDGNNEVCL